MTPFAFRSMALREAEEALVGPPVYPADYDPPAGRNYFTFRLSCNGERRREVRVGCLTDEELAWVERVINAEKERRYAL